MLGYDSSQPWGVGLGLFKEVKRVFKDTAIYGLGSLLPKAAGFILVPIMTRYLTKADYGITSLVMMIASMLGVVMMLGQNGAITLHMRTLHTEGRHDEAGIMLFSSVAFTLVFAAVVFGVLMAAGPTLTPWLMHSDTFTFDPFMATAFALAFIGVPLDLLQAVNRAKGQAKFHTVFQLSYFALNTTVTIIFVVLLRQGAFGFLKGNLAAEIVLAPIALYVLARNMKFKFSKKWAWASLLFGLPLIPHFFAGWILTFADRFMLERLRSLEEVGLYALAYNLSMILNLMTTAINQAWAPVYYDLASRPDERGKLPRLTTVYATAVTAAAAAYMLFSREVLLLLAAPKFHAAAPLVPIVVAGYYGFAMYAVLSTGIFYAKKTKIVPLISVAAAALNIGLNWLLIPYYGMWAAAWDTLIAYAFMAVLARIITGRLFPGSFEDGRLLRLVAIFGTAFLANFGVNALPFSVWVTLALKILLFASVMASFVVLRVITTAELRSVIRRVTRRVRGKRPATPAEEAALQAIATEAEGTEAEDYGPE